MQKIFVFPRMQMIVFFRVNSKCQQRHEPVITSRSSEVKINVCHPKSLVVKVSIVPKMVLKETIFTVVVLLNAIESSSWQSSTFDLIGKRQSIALSYSRQEYDANKDNVFLVDEMCHTSSQLRLISPFEQAIENESSPIFKMLKIASNREERGQPVLNFAVGNPSLEPPAAVLHSMAKVTALSNGNKRKGVYKYTNPSGLLPLREYIASEIGDWQQNPSLTADNVILTPGAQSGIVNILQALLLEGDTVLVQTPYYPDFLSMVELWGCHVGKINFDDKSFDLSLESIKQLTEKSGDRLRVMLLCSPSNPTGKVLGKSTIDSIIEIISEHSKKHKRDVWLVMDHTYWRLSYENVVPPTFPHYKSTLLISSFSKDMSLAGERIGYVTVNPKHQKSKQLAEFISQNNGRLGNISPPSLIQHALLDTYRTHGYLPSLMEEYEERVRLMHKGLLLAGMSSCYKPDGAFYLFPRLPDGIDDYDFAESLTNHGVLVIPGSEFGAPGFLRFAALEPECVMEEAFMIIRTLLLKYQKDIKRCNALNGQ